MRRPAPNSICQNLAAGGRFFNSYNPNDYALNFAMRVNDDALRGHGGSHYNRGNANYRTLTDNWFSNDSMERIPALMVHRAITPWPLPQLWYNHDALNLPAGAVPLEYARIGDEDNNIPANNFGWRANAHSDFVDPTAPNGLAGVFPWYRRVFNELQAIELGN